MNINKNIISFVLLSSLLTACSGGGGGSSNSDTQNNSNTLTTSTTAAQPAPQTPAVGEPVAAAPAPQAPAVGEPVAAAPAPQAPAVGEPVAAAPAPQAPAVGEPVAAAPAPAPQAPDVAEVKPLVPSSFNNFQAEYAEVTGDGSIQTHSSFGLSPSKEFNVKLSGTDLVVEAADFMIDDPRDHRTLLDHNLTVLRDVDGSLLGYYGRVSTETHLENAWDEDKVDTVTDTYVYSMDMNKRRLPDVAADYNGKVYYNKHELQREANISLHYEDRMVSGDIKGTAAGLNSDLHYVMNKNGNVDDNGSFSATMRRHYEREGVISGVINGAFYGEDASVAVGEVAMEMGETDGLARSTGVFGAKRVFPEGGK